MEQEVAGGSITEEWASLQPDLVRLIADCVLPTSGVDEYMAMRAVCPSRRSAVAKPSPYAAVADLRFRPRQWALLNGADDDQGRPLFLNVTTGRFRRLRRQVLRDYIFVGASDGLLVLGDRDRPHAARLLNPLTVNILHFAASIPPELWVETAVAGSEATIILSFEPWHGEYKDLRSYYSWQQGGNVVCFADPTGQLCAVKIHDAVYDEEGSFYLQSMITYAGDVYMLSFGGTLCKIVWTGGHWYVELGHLVESAGEMLLVKEGPKTIQLFSVDVNRKVLEPIDSIGSSALFLSFGKWMVVNADNLPSIKRNCIYRNCSDGTYLWYDLSDGKKKYTTSPQVAGDGPRAESDLIHEGPLSLAQVLLTPYPKIKAQLDRIQQL